MKTKDSDFLNLLATALSLKDVERAGWKRVLISRVESVADHTYGTAFLSMIMGDTLGLDTEKMMKMALLHDLSEAVTGDIVVSSAAERNGKHELEERVMEDLLSLLPAKLRRHYRGHWEELGANKSREARIVHELDKLEMSIQALRYRKTGLNNKAIREFIVTAEQELKNPELVKILKEVKKELSSLDR